MISEKELELSEKTKKEIKKARKEFKQGKWISFEEIKKKAGLK